MPCAARLSATRRPDRSETSRYRHVYAGIERRAGTSQENPMASEDFAREVSDAILRAKTAISRGPPASHRQRAG